MIPTHLNSTVVLTSLALMLVFPQFGAAQLFVGPPQRGSSLMIRSAPRLAAIEVVQAELQLTDEQNAKADEIAKRLTAEMRANSREAYENRAEVNGEQRNRQVRQQQSLALRDASEKLAPLLSDD